MRKHIKRVPIALRDAEGHVDYLKARSTDAADRFLDALEKTFQFLLANPESGQLCQFTDPRLAGIRVWPVHRFRNYLVYFRPTDDGIAIERILHGARDIEALFGERS